MLKFLFNHNSRQYAAKPPVFRLLKAKYSPLESCLLALEQQSKK